MKLKKSLSVLFIATFASTLTACGSLSTPVPVEIKPVQVLLLEKCPEHLPPLTGSTGADILVTLEHWALAYNICSARQRALVDAFTAR
jgi:hypothetical protein